MILGKDGKGLAGWPGKTDAEVSYKRGRDMAVAQNMVDAGMALTRDGGVEPVFLETTLHLGDETLLFLTDVSGAPLIDDFSPWLTRALLATTALNARKKGSRDRDRHAVRFDLDNEWSVFLGGALPFLAAAGCPALAGGDMKFGRVRKTDGLEKWMRKNWGGVTIFELRVRMAEVSPVSMDKMDNATSELCSLLSGMGVTTCTAECAWRVSTDEWTDIQKGVYAEMKAALEADRLGRAARPGCVAGRAGGRV